VATARARKRSRPQPSQEHTENEAYQYLGINAGARRRRHGWLIWSAATQPPLPAGDIVSKNGIHWHPELTISIKGQQQEIPANLGIGFVHNPIHTHDSTGVLHLEFEGRRVTKDDIRLEQFFKLWGKPFSSSCVLDKCNGPDGQLTVTVNGKPNTEFEQYIMRDKDQIEITYAK